jgi:hypothetical protein
MPTFTVGLARTYLVEVEAPNIESALQAADVIGYSDESWEIEREEIGFRIIEVKILEQNAFEVS